MSPFINRKLIHHPRESSMLTLRIQFNNISHRLIHLSTMKSQRNTRQLHQRGQKSRRSHHRTKHLKWTWLVHLRYLASINQPCSHQINEPRSQWRCLSSSKSSPDLSSQGYPCQLPLRDHQWYLEELQLLAGSSRARYRARERLWPIQVAWTHSQVRNKKTINNQQDQEGDQLRTLLEVMGEKSGLTLENEFVHDLKI